MGARISAAQEAAQKEWKKAPGDAKPSPKMLAKKHGLDESSIYRSFWWKNRNGEEQKGKQA